MANIGDTITYSIVVGNNGPNAETNAVVVDTLPTCVDFVSADNGGVYDATAGTITWNFATVPVSANAYTLTVVTTASVANTNCLNSVTASGDLSTSTVTTTDGDGNNNGGIGQVINANTSVTLTPTITPTITPTVNCDCPLLNGDFNGTVTSNWGADVIPDWDTTGSAQIGDEAKMAQEDGFSNPSPCGGTFAFHSAAYNTATITNPITNFISQTVNCLVVGNSYTFSYSFALAGYGADPSQVTLTSELSLDNTIVNNATITDTGDTVNWYNWQQVSYTFTATNTSGTFKMGSSTLGTDAFVALYDCASLICN